MKWLQSLKTAISGCLIACSSRLISWVELEIMLNGVGEFFAGLDESAFVSPHGKTGEANLI